MVGLFFGLVDFESSVVGAFVRLSVTLLGAPELVKGEGVVRSVLTNLRTWICEASCGVSPAKLVYTQIYS